MNTAFKYFTEQITFFYFPRVQKILPIFLEIYSLIKRWQFATVQCVLSGAPTPFFPHLLQMFAYIVAIKCLFM